jgi:hypothetical protein
VRLPALILVALALAGCDSGTGGDASTAYGPPKGVSAAAVRASAAKIVADWRAEVMSQGWTGPDRHFPSPPEAVLRRRLAAVADDHRLRLVRLEILHPRQDAPLVVLQGSSPRRLVDELPEILGAIDPQTDRGSAYEGFLLETLDAEGMPVAIAFNYWRGGEGGKNRGGGQWARSPDHFPYPHG